VGRLAHLIYFFVWEPHKKEQSVKKQSTYLQDLESLDSDVRDNPSDGDHHNCCFLDNPLSRIRQMYFRFPKRNQVSRMCEFIRRSLHPSAVLAHRLFIQFVASNQKAYLGYSSGHDCLSDSQYYCYT